MNTIRKRGILQFALLNIITFGIFGLIVGNGIGRDIDTICNGDEESEVSYIVAWLLGLITGGLYLEYWWYKQANRLKYNAGRYGLKIRESGLSLLAFRMMGRALGIVLAVYWLSTYISMSRMMSYMYSYSSLFPSMGYGVGIPSGITIVIKILVFIAIIMPSWGVMGYIGFSFLLKNLNRMSEVYDSVQALPYDPMGYEYYNAKCNFPLGTITEETEKVIPPEDRTMALNQGCILGISGNNAGYRFEVKDGEEIIIGKDPNLASVIIDQSYKELSRKHCSIAYLANTREYRVTDYSANGTFINGGRRLATRVPTNVSAGTEITLGTSDNKFRLE